MRVYQQLFKNGNFGLQPKGVLSDDGQKLLVIGFGAKHLLEDEVVLSNLQAQYPKSDILLCSTAGEIHDDVAYENSISVSALQFDKTRFATASINISDYQNSYEAGAHLFRQFDAEGMAYLLVLSDGGLVNGSQLVKGIENINQGRVPVTGGLAGDGAAFNYTVVGCNQLPVPGTIAAVAFYGSHLRIAHGSLGGWDRFGPEKVVTRSVGNRLYEIAGKSALDLYKQYLGKYAGQLPGSALLFPLSVKLPGSEAQVVRTILSIDNEDQCMVFAGDIPVGSLVRFMKANLDKLVDAAGQAASQAQVRIGGMPKFALLVSCIGRKLILGKRVDEELEAVREVVGQDTLMSGFYSYGEISPLTPHASCELNNQTMTITTFDED